MDRRYSSQSIILLIVGLLVGLSLGYFIGSGEVVAATSVATVGVNLINVYVVLAVICVGVLYNIYENWRQRIMLESLQDVNREQDKDIHDLKQLMKTEDQP